MGTTLRRVAGAAAVAGLFASALWVLARELREFRAEDIRAVLAAVPASRVLLAALATLASYTVLTGYEALALRYLAAPGGLALPSVLAAVTALVSRGPPRAVRPAEMQ